MNCISYKGRSVADGQEVEVYRNLNNGLWSVRDAKSNLVLCHALEVNLDHVEFVVRESGRERVLLERRKNVHAYASGIYRDGGLAASDVHDSVWITYNPYKHGTFIDKREQAVRRAERVHFTVDKEVYGIGVE